MSTVTNIQQIGDLAADLDDPIGRIKHFIAALDAMVYLVHDDDHEGNPRGLQSTLWDMLHLTRKAQEELSDSWKKLMAAIPCGTGATGAVKADGHNGQLAKMSAEPTTARDAVLAWERARIDYEAANWTEANDAEMTAEGRRVGELQDIAMAAPCRSLADANALLRLVAYESEGYIQGRVLLPAIKSIQDWMVAELDETAAEKADRNNGGDAKVSKPAEPTEADQ